ncbi:MAG: hypothetical protein II815_04685 [Bacteroidales bacterium]|nr:hypothetical protein [Bacteroidales bacterium]
MEIEEKELRLAFYQLEKFYRPLFDFYTEHQEEIPQYKGSVTINSYLCYQPDVLILGYNPGHGKYHDWNKDKAHLVYTGERPLGVFEYGNANKNGKWYELNKSTHNPYPRNIVEFIFQLAKENKWENSEAENRRPTWANSVENRIMQMNLYPIGTKDSAALRKLFSDELKLMEELFSNKFDNEWAFRKFLLTKLHNFIDNKVKPKTILCLGKSTMSDYCWSCFEESQYKEVFVSKMYSNVVGVSRSGTWDGRIKNAAKLISEILSKN